LSGRPSSWTPELQARVVQNIEDGLYLEDAAWKAGITDVTVRAWMKRPEAEYVAFLAAVKEAEARLKHRLTERILAGAKEWVALMTFLERRFREQYGRTTQLVDSKGADVAEQWRAIIEASQKKRGKKA
jgi:hypothetical protein